MGIRGSGVCFIGSCAKGGLELGGLEGGCTVRGTEPVRMTTRIPKARRVKERERQR